MIPPTAFINPLLVIAPVVIELVPFFMSPKEVREVQDKLPVVIALVPLSIPDVTIELVHVKEEQVNAPVVIE